MKKVIKNIAFGAVIGASILIPGMSGGTTALILGIYSRIIAAIDELFSDFKKNFPYLLILTAGAAVGFYVCSFPIKFILDRYSFEFSFFVIGVIAGSLPIFVKGAGKFKIKYILYTIIGAALTLLVDMSAGVRLGNTDNAIIFILVGLLSAVALILPGISLTYILIAFGYYDSLIIAVNSIDILFLLKFGSVVIIGIFAFTKVLNIAYKKYPVSINMMILGMVAASVKQIFIRLPMYGEIAPCLLLLVGGFSVSLLFGLLGKGTDCF